MQFAKSKTVKVLKTLIEKFEQVPDSLDDQIFVCEKSIEFAKREKKGVFEAFTLDQIGHLTLPKETVQGLISID